MPGQQHQAFIEQNSAKVEVGGREGGREGGQGRTFHETNDGHTQRDRPDGNIFTQVHCFLPCQHQTFIQQDSTKVEEEAASEGAWEIIDCLGAEKEEGGHESGDEEGGEATATAGFVVEGAGAVEGGKEGIW